MKNIISMSGDIGGGKSSVAQSLNKLMGYEVIGTGSIQRRIAEKRGLTTLELNKISQTDRSVDDEIDSYVVELGVSKDNLLIDSRLAWHFIPDSFKVYLSVDSVIGGERVYGASRSSESNPSLSATIENNAARQTMEISRFKSLYNIKFRDYSNYDLIIDTSYASPDTIAQKIFETFKKWKAGSRFSKAWVSPKTLIPTLDIRTLDAKDDEEMVTLIQQADFLEGAPVDIFICRDFSYLWDGHKRSIAAIKAGIDLLPARILTNDPEFELNSGVSASSIARKVTPLFIGGWEDALGFRYKTYPQAQ